MNIHTLDSQTKQLIDRELHDGETLLWTGKPTRKRAIRRQFFARTNSLYASVILLMICWAAWFGALVLILQTDDAKFVHDGLIVTSIPCMVVTLISIVPPAVHIWRAMRTVYVLTDQRAIIMVRPVLFWKPLRWYGEGDIEKIERREYRDGTGDLVFAYHHHHESSVTDDGFFGITQARQVELLMLEMFKIRSSHTEHKYQDDPSIQGG